MLAVGLGAQEGLERSSATERPQLRRKLAELPLQLGDWAGQDEAIDPEIREKSQATECLSRTYTNPRRPGIALRLWINYSETGLNLRHSPEVCLPGNGYTKVESDTRVLGVPRPSGGSTQLTRLSYAKDDMAQGVGFWYYIFGEGPVEHFVRTLPITSRSSHGRTTRGSGLTVEVFCPGDTDPEGAALSDFAAALLDALEPTLPDDRAQYHRP